MTTYLVIKSAERGMVVNDQKTLLMCISAAVSFEARAVIYDSNGQPIRSAKSMKLLGYTLDSNAEWGHT